MLAQPSGQASKTWDLHSVDGRCETSRFGGKRAIPQRLKSQRALEGTRTPTALRPLVPETSASTNSATRACDARPFGAQAGRLRDARSTALLVAQRRGRHG